jgi:steroid 5-alpha reductase family enzyme
MNAYLILLITLWIYMSFWFLISVEIKRNDIADVAWGLGFAMMAGISFFISGQTSIRSILVFYN